MSATTTEEYIYGLYSGKLRNDELVEDPSYGEIVYVFDWEGIPVRKLVLEYPVRSIAIDEKNQVLYAGTMIDKDPKLVHIDIDPIHNVLYVITESDEVYKYDLGKIPEL